MPPSALFTRIALRMSTAPSSRWRTPPPLFPQASVRSLTNPEDVVTASVIYRTPWQHRGFPRGMPGVRETRVDAARGGSGILSSAAARGPRKIVARPGGFGRADRTAAGLVRARGTHHIPNERSVRAGPSPFPG